MFSKLQTSRTDTLCCSVMSLYSTNTATKARKELPYERILVLYKTFKVPFSSNGIRPQSKMHCTTCFGPLARLPKMTADSTFRSIETQSLDISSSNLQTIVNAMFCRAHRWQLTKYHVRPALWELHWLPLAHRIKFKVALLIYMAHNRLCPV